MQFVQTDVTSWDSQIAAFKSALSFSPSGTLDIVIPNAGLGGTNWIREMPTDLPEGADPPRPNTKVYEVNLIAVHYTAYLGLYYFRQAPASDTKRQILFVSSLAGYGELPLEVDYQAAKYGVRGIFKSLRKSGDPFGGVRFNLLAPTFIKSPMTEKSLALIASMGIKIGVVGDVTDGAMRCLCDETVNGKSCITLTMSSFLSADQFLFQAALLRSVPAIQLGQQTMIFAMICTTTTLGANSGSMYKTGLMAAWRRLLVDYRSHHDELDAL